LTAIGFIITDCKNFNRRQLVVDIVITSDAYLVLVLVLEYSFEVFVLVLVLEHTALVAMLIFLQICAL